MRRLPACSVQRPAPQDRGGYTDSRGRYIAPFSRAGDGIPCDGFYSGEHNAKATQIFGALYDEMKKGEAWSDSRSRDWTRCARSLVSLACRSLAAFSVGSGTQGFPAFPGHQF